MDRLAAEPRQFLRECGERSGLRQLCRMAPDEAALGTACLVGGLWLWRLDGVRRLIPRRRAEACEPPEGRAEAGRDPAGAIAQGSSSSVVEASLSSSRSRCRWAMK